MTSIPSLFVFSSSSADVDLVMPIPPRFSWMYFPMPLSTPVVSILTPIPCFSLSLLVQLTSIEPKHLAFSNYRDWFNAYNWFKTYGSICKIEPARGSQFLLATCALASSSELSIAIRRWLLHRCYEIIGRSQLPLATRHVRCCILPIAVRWRLLP